MTGGDHNRMPMNMQYIQPRRAGGRTAPVAPEKAGDSGNRRRYAGWRPVPTTTPRHVNHASWSVHRSASQCLRRCPIKARWHTLDLMGHRVHAILPQKCWWSRRSLCGHRPVAGQTFPQWMVVDHIHLRLGAHAPDAHHRLRINQDHCSIGSLGRSRGSTKGSSAPYSARKARTLRFIRRGKTGMAVHRADAPPAASASASKSACS